MRPQADLREFLARVEAIGQLEVVRGADWNLEIGVISEVWGSDAQALLFDDIVGYPSGYRVLTNALNSPQRIGIAAGLGPVEDRVELTRALRDKLHAVRPVEPVLVADGPVLENVRIGQDVDLLRFPVPFFHELDGGRFIGTGCLTITRDPDADWINFGAYRIMVHDARSAGVYITRGKHGLMHIEKYWARGEPAPIAVSVGHDPLLFMCSGVEIPYGVSEYAYAGGLRGAPVEVVRGPATGLPVPAHAEIVIEGEVWPGDERDEGPFGEWTGYYASGTRSKPVIRVRSICHRDDPILLAAAPGKPPSDNTYFLSPFKSAGIWDEVERAGVPGVVGVWQHAPGGGRLFLVIAIRALYPGHSKQAGHVAAQCHQGAYANRYVVVVDHDVDAADLDDVLWAMCTRVDLRTDVDVIHRCWTSPIDPMHYPEGEGRDIFASRMIIDATRPWERRSDFPPIASASEAVRDQVRARWADLFARRRPARPAQPVQPGARHAEGGRR